MTRVFGYGLLAVGLLGFIFFWTYKGKVIPLRELWFVLSIFTIVAGTYFYAKYKLKKLRNQRSNGNSNRLAEIEQLKRTGHKVRATLDNAEVKYRCFQQEIINEGLPSDMEMLDAVYDPHRNYKTQEVKQTYIVFYKQCNGKTHKFVSHATTQHADAVKRYIERQNGIDLYIDPVNPTSYYFDLPWVW